jgi:hypothetical protein
LLDFAYAYIIGNVMLLNLHLLGAAFFLVSVVGSGYVLLVNSTQKKLWSRLLQVSASFQIISGVFLLFSGGASLGRVCAMSLIVLAIAYPLRRRLLVSA